MRSTVRTKVRTVLFCTVADGHPEAADTGGVICDKTACWKSQADRRSVICGETLHFRRLGAE